MSVAQQAEGNVTRRRSSILIRCALVVLSIVFTLLIFEGALRLVFYLRVPTFALISLLLSMDCR